MKRLIFIIIPFLFSCSVSYKNINQLIDGINIDNNVKNGIKSLVLIPGNGCHSCIKNAIDDIHFTEDTVYVVVCKSEREFNLLTGKNLGEYSNVYLDRKYLCFSLGFLEATPSVIVLNNGKIKEVKGFHKETESAKNGSSLVLSNTRINLGTIKKDDETKFDVIFENKGSDKLNITEIELSCECLSSCYSSFNLEVGENKNVSFRLNPDSSGELYRTITIYGNFKESPLEIEIEGFVN